MSEDFNSLHPAADSAPENLSDALADFNLQMAVNHDRLMQIHCGLSNLFRSSDPHEIEFVSELFRHSHQTALNFQEAALIAVHGGSADEDASQQVQAETQVYVDLCLRALSANPEQIEAACKLLAPAPAPVTTESE